jgi:hypothetical protein
MRCDACEKALHDGDEAMLVPYRVVSVRGIRVDYKDAERVLCLPCAGVTVP